VIGNVTIGPEVSIWPCAVLRGDFGFIEICARTSIQDCTVVVE
jgi:carbonic anhydrase/acetyltransferase-like protein (isoleucine patch superfamily)